jgi:hypothetical protein
MSKWIHKEDDCGVIGKEPWGAHLSEMENGIGYVLVEEWRDTRSTPNAIHLHELLLNVSTLWPRLCYVLTSRACIYLDRILLCRLDLNSESSCLSLLCAGITRVYHHVQQRLAVNSENNTPLTLPTLNKTQFKFKLCYLDKSQSPGSLSNALSLELYILFRVAAFPWLSQSFIPVSWSGFVYNFLLQPLR